MRSIRSRHRSRRRSRYRRAVRMVVGIALLAASIGLPKSQPPLFRVVTLPDDEEAFETRRTNALRRAVYRYSVIPGGIQDGEELREAIRKDPVVADHYRRFHSDRAYPVTLQNARAVHLSYRLNNVVYWTKNKVTLAAGEELITDGDKFARARCGNQVSIEPQEPTFDNEPPPQDLLVEEFIPPNPPVPEFPPPMIFVTPPPPSPPGEPPLLVVPPPPGIPTPPVPTEPLRPVLPPPSPTTPPGPPFMPTFTPPVSPLLSPPPRTTIVSVPEPSTIALFGSGLLASLALWRLQKRS